MTRWASWFHKWLALLMAIQILFWFVSGLFFAIAPIETVRSEHRVVERETPAYALTELAARFEEAAAADGGRASRVELTSLLGRPVALIGSDDEAPRLIDLGSGATLSPLSPGLARRIAEADLSGKERALAVSPVTAESTEYRGSLPAWRVDFETADRAIYVAANTGEVTARRSTLWRTFDFLWSLHIMDFENHEDFNTPLLIGATLLGLVIIMSGMMMFPQRLGWTAWLRRRRRRRAAST